MHYTHNDMERPFRVPFGPWLIPTVGSILCILLMKGISKETGYRFGVWTGIGQVIYFSHGFWHSNRRPQLRVESLNNAFPLVCIVEQVASECAHNGSELNSNIETTESSAQKVFILRRSHIGIKYLN
jgi:hypothetical protein